MADIRKFKTKQSIENALAYLLNEKSFKSITVDNICKQALTSRSTFYLHYLDKYDLLNQIVEKQLHVFEKNVSKRVEDLITGQFEKTIVQFYDELIERRLIIEVLFSIDEQAYNLKPKFEKILYTHWLKYLSEESNVKHKKLVAKFGASMVFDTLDWTFENGIDTETLTFVEDIRKKILELSNGLS
ncbi:AcrR family transcriptional regulator [Leuconostoc litchii]|uniref:TetR/AcrR family transcriptional regulator n=1 Tax=Leuconostoc litchii TaxID=1981069 RepID=A0A6P2CLE7_9LACO|nr:TetR family transcriptional regulator [Leuconostoc litchii]TYC46810.1 TetR/AcrR family transcriptional regulator [Leuconostoc litchii]GMA70702.1 AcrR family transcriptional regulator [Leuconostoc litchii]